jgi:hypothetical protein
MGCRGFEDYLSMFSFGLLNTLYVAVVVLGKKSISLGLFFWLQWLVSD